MSSLHRVNYWIFHVSILSEIFVKSNLGNRKKRVDRMETTTWATQLSV